jgi:hypothetical protein
MKQHATRPYLTNPINQIRQHTNEAECKDTKKFVKSRTRASKAAASAGTAQREKPYAIVYKCSVVSDDITSGESGVDLHVVSVFILCPKLKHGQNRGDGDEDCRGGIMYAQARAPPESKHGRFECR